MHEIAHTGRDAPPTSDLPARWRRRARMLAAHGATQAARTLRLAAHELDRALRDAESLPLTLAEAARESGYSADHLRRLIADGVVPNAGRKGAPRVRRGDVPRRTPRPAARGFDPAAAIARMRKE